MNLHETAVAHRGGAGLAPENTLRAFETSVALGIRLLETDVRVTRDGVALAFHDAHLARTTGVQAKVAERTWSELADVRIAGEPLLRLDSLLDAFPHASFLIDLKEGRAISALIDTLRRQGCAERVCVAGGWDPWLRAVTDATGVSRSLGWRGLSALMWGARFGVTPPAAALRGTVAAHLPTRLAGFDWMADERVGSRLIDMAHDAGLRVLTWTVNEPAAMRRYLDAGSDAVITDRPDLLREVLISRGSWTGFGTAHGKTAPAVGSTATRTLSPARSA